MRNGAEQLAGMHTPKSWNCRAEVTQSVELHAPQRCTIHVVLHLHEEFEINDIEATAGASLALLVQEKVLIAVAKLRGKMAAASIAETRGEEENREQLAAILANAD